MKKFLAITMLLLSGISSTPALSDEPDTRQTLQLNSSQRHHILSEMRMLLQGMQAIIQSLAEEDMPAVVQHARALGTKMPHKGEDHLHAVLPESFMKIGMSVHRSFDQIAEEAESAQDIRPTLKRLSDVVQICSTCHAAYQIQVSTSPEGRKSSAEHDHHRENTPTLD